MVHSNYGRRRALILASSACLVGAGSEPRTSRAEQDFVIELSALETRLGGRIGVMALDVATGRRLAHRENERFAMASTFKWLLAACILWHVDRGDMALDQAVAYTVADLLPHSPVTQLHLAHGGASIGILAEAAVEESDNGATNLLLRHCGGPAGLTRYLRSVGDLTTRLDRTELALNTNLPDDPRDTTTPRAMVATMNTVLLGQALSPGSRARLILWLQRCATGTDRLRAGLPKAWVAGDKTGHGERGAVNDLAIAWPSPHRAPILIACYMSGSTARLEDLEAAHARIGSAIASALV